MQRIFRLVLFLVVSSALVLAQDHSSMPGMQPGSPAEGGSNAMSTRHLEMGGHMRLTETRPLKPGDQQRADEVLAGARRVAAEYRDYKDAEADGYRIFLPNVPQKMYHFTNY